MTTLDPSSKRLLVVDDEAEIRKLVREVAEPLGWKVSEASSGREMMDCFHSVAPDMIFLDIIMLDVDGIEAIQWLGKQRCAARIVAMTGYSPAYTIGATKLGEAHGVNVVHSFQKPIPIAQLRAVLGQQ